MSIPLPEGVEIIGPMPAAYAEILTPQALVFVAKLARKFEGRRRELMALRARRQAEFNAGKLPDFLAETRHVREGDWTIGTVPADLQDRRVEITGPTDRKMVINALNSGANVFMADFEDSNAPTWSNMIEGQINLRHAIRRSITFRSPEGRNYQLDDRIATLLVRPRGWHLLEQHLRVDGEPVSGAIFDFALYVFHNAKEALARDTGPYYYLPKLESHLEARLWNDIFVTAQRELGLPLGTIKATVLIETVLAAFEMDEILHELREHCVGLNIGRWDYIFSCIKKFRSNKNFCLADRSQVTMTAPFMRAYALLLIKTCHKRKAFAMGGMAAQIPIKGDAEANSAALAKVRADKEREVGDGHDGTWVAHPGLVGLAREVFDQAMPGPNQIARSRQDVSVAAADLLKVPEGTITERGLRRNLSVGTQYVAAWLGGLGCVPLYNLMEDSATAEICRAQVWQWLRHGVSLADGPAVDETLVRRLLAEELDAIASSVEPERFATGRYAEAAELMGELVTAERFEEFLTLPAYDRLIKSTKAAA